MATPVLLPRRGNSNEACRIVRWLKRVGEPVREGEAIVEVETDKAVVEVESPATGTLLERLFPEGADVAVLTPIALIGNPGEGAAPPPTVPAASRVSESIPQLPAREPVTAPKSAPQPCLPAQAASPRAARLAYASGMDLARVAGTGPQGRIIERDVRSALAHRKPQEFSQSPGGPLSNAGASVPAQSSERASSPEFPGPTREVVFTGTRLMIAERMRRSLEQAAQLTLHAAADVTMLLDLRGRLNAQREASGQERLSLNDFVLLAVSRVLQDCRSLNAHCLADRVIEYEHVHLGIAVETPRGLLAPVIRFAERHRLDELAAEARRLANACREGTVRREDLQGGTFTVTNLGALGVETFTPILNPPEVAILGVGGIQHRPRPGHPGDPCPHLLLSLTFDHRALDGAPAARFLGRLAETMAKIDLLAAGALSAGQPSTENSNCSPPCPNL